MPVEIVFYIFVFIVGTIIGSFLNVLILRYNTGFSPVKGRSFCFSCGKTLGFFELIPILSFLFQGGKCAGCRSRISWQYPVVEFLTGLLFLGVSIKFLGLIGLYFNFWYIILFWITVAVLIAIAVYDLRHKIIPNGLVITFSFLALLKILIDYWQLPGIAEEIRFHSVAFLLSGPILALPFFLIWLFSKGRWMGLGDPKLILGIGWFFGPVMGLSAIILAFWSGALYGLILLLLSKINFLRLGINGKTEVPFAPFLIFGFLLVFFFNFDVLGLDFLIP